MRKRITGSAQGTGETGREWLSLEQMATVEVTSEDAGFPIEAALVGESGGGWRAAERGEQRIRILFDEPQRVRQVHLRFEEKEVERTQEFTLRWSSATHGVTKEIVRQQWNFSPGGSAVEVEEYAVDLEDVSALELVIRPDVGGGGAVATLAAWRVR